MSHNNKITKLNFNAFGNQKVKSFIFNENINKNTKLVPLNKRKNFLGEVKYFPANSKEWKNNVYFFNVQNIKNFPAYDLNINKLIKGYFNIYFNNHIIISKYKSSRFHRLSFNRIFVSKGEVKHTNSKAIITIYTYNRERISLLKRIKKLVEAEFIKTKGFAVSFFLRKILLFFFKGKKIYKNLNIDFYQKAIKLIFYEKLVIIRRYILKLNLNKFKSEEKFLHRLAKLISKFYKKKIEFNIVNLKSIVLNADLFTEILTLKLKKKNFNVLKTMNIILRKVNLLKINKLKERSRIIKTINFNLLENKYKNPNLNFILEDKVLLNMNLMSNIKENSIATEAVKNTNKNFDEFFHKLYDSSLVNNSESAVTLKDALLKKIKYKILGGIRLEVKGRLTKRYRADRALFKVKWKGGLKNIDSSFRGLSSVKYRGFVNSNVQYSILASKRRIGSFAVKGWISGR
jgi:hypothetical protein